MSGSKGEIYVHEKEQRSLSVLVSLQQLCRDEETNCKSNRKLTWLNMFKSHRLASLAWVGCLPLLALRWSQDFAFLEAQDPAILVQPYEPFTRVELKFGCCRRPSNGINIALPLSHSELLMQSVDSSMCPPPWTCGAPWTVLTLESWEQGYVVAREGEFRRVLRWDGGKGLGEGQGASWCQQLALGCYSLFPLPPCPFLKLMQAT